MNERIIYNETFKKPGQKLLSPALLHAQVDGAPCEVYIKSRSIVERTVNKLVDGAMKEQPPKQYAVIEAVIYYEKLNTPIQDNSPQVTGKGVREPVDLGEGSKLVPSV